MSAQKRTGIEPAVRAMTRGARSNEAKVLRAQALTMAAIVDDPDTPQAVRVRANVELRACLSDYSALLADEARKGEGQWGTSRLSAV